MITSFVDDIGDVMAARVFVFGTLKEGFPNFSVNLGVRVPGIWRTREKYPLYLIGERFSPWLVDIPGQGYSVSGQVFDVDSDTLDAMDKLERITEPDGYRRVALDVEEENIFPVRLLSVFIYLKPASLLVSAEVRDGPLDVYTLEHAARYRSRASTPLA